MIDWVLGMGGIIIQDGNELPQKTCLYCPMGGHDCEIPKLSELSLIVNGSVFEKCIVTFDTTFMMDDREDPYQISVVFWRNVDEIVANVVFSAYGVADEGTPYECVRCGDRTVVKGCPFDEVFEHLPDEDEDEDWVEMLDTIRAATLRLPPRTPIVLSL
jgi:hypothetical protein